MIKDFFPYTRYDFIVYVLSGIMVLAIIDHAFMQNWFIGSNLNLANSIRLLVISYIIGIIVDTFSYLVFENYFVSKQLYPPLKLILKIGNQSKREERIIKLMYREKYKEVKKDNIEASRRYFLKRYERDFNEEDLAEFLNCGIELLQENELARNKAERLRLHYEFCRNISLVSILIPPVYIGRISCDLLVDIEKISFSTYALYPLLIVISIGIFCIFIYRFSYHYFDYINEIFMLICKNAPPKDFPKLLSLADTYRDMKNKKE